MAEKFFDPVRSAVEAQPVEAPEPSGYDFGHNKEESAATDAHIAFPGSPEDEKMFKERESKERIEREKMDRGAACFEDDLCR